MSFIEVILSTMLFLAAEHETAARRYRVLALYKFVKPRLSKESLKELQADIETACQSHHVKGTLLLAEEGINGTICYPFDHHNNDDNSSTQQQHGDDDTLLMFLQSKFDNALRIRISTADRAPFARFKIKIKKEIVTMHQKIASEEQQPSCCANTTATAAATNSTAAVYCDPSKQVGEYIKPHDWNALLLDPDTLVIDTRNEYEIDVGTFRNAVNPHTQSFVEFPEWMKDHLMMVTNNNGDDQDDTAAFDAAAASNTTTTDRPKRIAMFCTGGIRCEKATSACLQLVPKDVSVCHLEGGILAYLDDIPPEQSLFDGDCYVFDQRIAVTHGLKQSTTYQQSCHGCRHPLSNDDVKRNDFVEGVSCRYCTETLTERKQERYVARQRQIELAMSGKETCHDIFLRN